MLYAVSVRESSFARLNVRSSHQLGTTALKSSFPHAAA